MKSRLLTKLLNNTGYTVNNNDDYIGIGSPYAHDLISVDKKTLKVKYALDTFKKGRDALLSSSQGELLFIWDRLHELIKTKEINDIINGTDEIDNPLPVFTVKSGQLIKTFTDKYGYPNTTIDGYLMYENVYFETKEQAIQNGMKEYRAGISLCDRRVSDIKLDLEKYLNNINRYKKYIKHLQSL